MVRVGPGGDQTSAPDTGGGTGDTTSGTPDDGFDNQQRRDDVADRDPAPEPEPAPEPSDGGSSGGGVVDRVASTLGNVSNTVDRVTDPVTDPVSETIDTVSGGVNDVSETLPGPTGTAFATGAAVAAVPEPTPITETTGAAIAGGAALVGGGVLASRALRNRGSELEIGERVRSELGVGQQNQDVSEVGVGERVTSEVGVGETGPSTTEVGLGSTTAVDEIQVGSGDRFGASAGAAVGAGTDTDDGIGPTIDAPDEPSIERDIDESGGSTTGTIERDPVRFPANEGATGTAPDVIDQQVPDFDPADAFGVGTATGAGGLLDGAPSGLDSGSPGEDVIGSGTDPATGTDPDNIVDPGDSIEPTADPGTGPATEPGAEPTAGGLTEQTTVSEVFGSAQTEVPGQAAAEATPELAAFEAQSAEVTQTTRQPAQGDPSRDPPRPSLPGGDDDDERAPLAFATDADQFGSGLLGGSEAAAQFFGDGR